MIAPSINIVFQETLRARGFKPGKTLSLFYIKLIKSTGNQLQY